MEYCFTSAFVEHITNISAADIPIAYENINSEAKTLKLYNNRFLLAPASKLKKSNQISDICEIMKYTENKIVDEQTDSQLLLLVAIHKVFLSNEFVICAIDFKVNMNFFFLYIVICNMVPSIVQEMN